MIVNRIWFWLVLIILILIVIGLIIAAATLGANVWHEPAFWIFLIIGVVLVIILLLLAFRHEPDPYDMVDDDRRVVVTGNYRLQPTDVVKRAVYQAEEPLARCPPMLNSAANDGTIVNPYTNTRVIHQPMAPVQYQDLQTARSVNAYTQSPVGRATIRRPAVRDPYRTQYIANPAYDLIGQTPDGGLIMTPRRRVTSIDYGCPPRNYQPPNARVITPQVPVAIDRPVSGPVNNPVRLRQYDGPRRPLE